MKAWLQRVSEASVTIDGESVASIAGGYLILLGITHGDSEAKADEIVAKIPVIRLFGDENGKMNRSLMDIGGEVIVVSQFTLYADMNHGRRPGFSAAAKPDVAEPLYRYFVKKLREAIGTEKVGTGRFGADMKVSLVNDGPVSIELLA